MVTVLSIFGITMVAASLPVIAQDAPGPDPPPASGKGLTCSSNKPSKEIIKALGGAAATVCSLAITSGSFFVGPVCGVVVVYGILKTQGK